MMHHNLHPLGRMGLEVSVAILLLLLVVPVRPGGCDEPVKSITLSYPTGTNAFEIQDIDVELLFRDVSESILATACFFSELSCLDSAIHAEPRR